MPPVPMDLSPDEQARVAAAGARSEAAADAKTELPSSDEKTSDAHGAVQEPRSEADARAQAEFIEVLGEEPQPDPRLVELCAELQSAIAENRPTSEQEIAKANPQQTAQRVGRSLNGQVEASAREAGSQAQRIETPPPGQSGAQAQPLENPPEDVPAPDIAADQARPNELPPSSVSLQADVKAQDQKLTDAGMKTEPALEAAKSGEGPLADAQKAEGELGELAKTAPDKVLAEQKAALAKADATLSALQGQTVAALQRSRSTGIASDRSKQDRMVLSEQQKREKASADAKTVYKQASDDVGALIKAMPEAIRGKWDAGIKVISTEFETSLAKVKNWIELRYSGVGGFFNKLGDAFVGLPDEIVNEYRAAEAKFGRDASNLALSLSASINGTLMAVDKIIKNARDRINAIFDSLGPELAAWATEQKAGFDKDFAGLRERARKQAADLQADLLKNTVESVQDARQKIQELRDATKGLIDQIEDAAAEFARDPAKFVINGLLKLVGISPDAFWAVVAKVQQVVDDIAKDPMTFANNLVGALKLGFQQFFGNIGTHLLQGLIDWLCSALGEVGVEVPKDLSVRSMVTLFLQIMGLSWPRIRKIIVKHVGEKNVALVEKAWSLVSMLIAQGPGGIFELIKEKLDPRTIVDAVLSAAKDYLIKVLIERVAVQIVALFNPVGAIAKALVVIYDALKWVFQNAAKIFSLVETVVNAMADVMSGNIGGVASAIEKALAGLLGPVIGLLAEMIGIGDLPQAIAGVIKGLQEQVAAILDQVIAFLVEKAKALMAALGIGGKKKPGKFDGQVGDVETWTADGESHRLWIVVSGPQATVMMASQEVQVEQALALYETKAQAMAGSGDKEDAGKEALALIADARGILASLAPEANNEAAAVAAGKTEDPKAADELASQDDKVEGLEAQLKGALAAIQSKLGINPAKDASKLRALRSSIGSTLTDIRKLRKQGKIEAALTAAPEKAAELDGNVSKIEAAIAETEPQYTALVARKQKLEAGTQMAVFDGLKTQYEALVALAKSTQAALEDIRKNPDALAGEEKTLRGRIVEAQSEAHAARVDPAVVTALNDPDRSGLKDKFNATLADVDARVAADLDKKKLSELRVDAEAAKDLQKLTQEVRSTAKKSPVAAQVQILIDKIDRTIAQNTKGSQGDGTSEAAAKTEAETGQKVGGRYHGQKCKNDGAGLLDDVANLEKAKTKTSDTNLLASIDAAIQRAKERAGLLAQGVAAYRASPHEFIRKMVD